MLQDVIAWQERNNYPLTFFTEASIDLADDAELMELMVRANFIADVHRHREPRRGVAPRGEEVPERPLRRDPAGEGPPHPGRRHGGLVRHDHGLRQRRRGDLRAADPVRPGGADRLLDERDARGDPQDAAARPAGRRGPARHGRRLRVRHQRHPAQHEPRGAARRLHPRHERDLRARAPTSSGPTPCSSSRPSTYGIKKLPQLAHLARPVPASSSPSSSRRSACSSG